MKPAETRPAVAMLLAAGRGERMRPLTDARPKPLLEAGGKPLIVWHIERLARSGLRELVINLAHLGDQIESALGDGSRWGVSIKYSVEEQALETGGGIARALPLLGSRPFLAVNADIWTDFDFSTLKLDPEVLAHLILVDNPVHNPGGDFGLENGLINNGEARRLTFSGIGLYRPVLFDGCPSGAFPLAPLLRAAADRGQVAGSRHAGRWADVGTPARLAELDADLRGDDR